LFKGIALDGQTPHGRQAHPLTALRLD